MTTSATLPRYDRTKTYEWNYDHPPAPVELPIPEIPGEWSFCGKTIASPIGMPAGPLLNSGWILYYASLGFDVLTYKTARSIGRECYPLPNLQPVVTGQLQGGEENLPATDGDQPSWAVSFGMPSKTPDVWRDDVTLTRDKLAADKVLSVSVVGSIQEGWSIDDLAQDYAQCAYWALESGADCVETNFSCPNVSTCDGQLYQVPESAHIVTGKVRELIGNRPYIVKVGHLTTVEATEQLIDAIGEHVNAIAMTNSVAATITSIDSDRLLFDGEKRGICGDATRSASIAQTIMVSEIIKRRGLDIDVIGVGGISTTQHVRDYLNAGAQTVQLASAAMMNPAVGIEILEQLAEG